MIKKLFFKEEEDLIDDFLTDMTKVKMLHDVDKKKKYIKNMKKTASKIKRFKGWPKKEKFWDFEASYWDKNVGKNIRQCIKRYLDKNKKGKVLELGAGSIQYIKDSYLADISKEMLKNIKCSNLKKIICDLDKDIPLPEHSFDTITLVFLVNYLKNFPRSLKKIIRLLKKDGKLIIIQSQEINSFYDIVKRKNWDRYNLKRLFLKNKLSFKYSKLKSGQRELDVFQVSKDNIFK